MWQLEMGAVLVRVCDTRVIQMLPWIKIFQGLEVCTVCTCDNNDLNAIICTEFLWFQENPVSESRIWMLVELLRSLTCNSGLL